MDGTTQGDDGVDEPAPGRRALALNLEVSIPPRQAAEGIHVVPIPTRGARRPARSTSLLGPRGTERAGAGLPGPRLRDAGPQAAVAAWWYRVTLTKGSAAGIPAGSSAGRDTHGARGSREGAIAARLGPSSAFSWSARHGGRRGWGRMDAGGRGKMTASGGTCCTYGRMAMASIGGGGCVWAGAGEGRVPHAHEAAWIPRGQCPVNGGGILLPTSVLSSPGRRRVAKNASCPVASWALL